jgi:hypothetical protein
MNLMNEKDNRETNDLSLVIEDLSTVNTEGIKGGERPKEYLTIVVKDQFICG